MACDVPLGWSTIPLGEFTTLQRGIDLPETQRTHGPIPVMGSFGVTGYHNEARTKGPGVVVGRSGASFGVVSFSPVDFWPLNTALYVKDFHGNDPRFAYYLLTTFDFKRFNSGSAQPSLNRNFVHPVEVLVPPIEEQRSITAVLGALDDKIELNRRMSRTLEEMAQAIFKSWFVDFDGYDDLIDSDLGPIPRGWKVKPATALIDFNPKVRLERGAVAPFADMKALPTDGAIADEVAARPFTGGGAKFCRGDTLLARITPCLENGKTALVDFLEDGEAGFGSTEFTVMRGRSDVSPEFVYCMARSETFRTHAITHMTGSSGRQRVQGDAFEHFRVAVPPAERLREFAAVAEPMFRKISANARESRALAELRDALLPRLISGELRVSNMMEDKGGV